MRSKSAKRMVGKWINVPKRQDFRFWPLAEVGTGPIYVRKWLDTGHDKLQDNAIGLLPITVIIGSDEVRSL
jgi:hypothetical protein